MSIPNHNATGEEIQQFIERIEQIEAEMKEKTEDRKEVYAELKGRGFDAKVIRSIIADRKKDREDLEEFQSVKETYLNALMEII